MNTMVLQNIGMADMIDSGQQNSGQVELANEDSLNQTVKT